MKLLEVEEKLREQVLETQLILEFQWRVAGSAEISNMYPAAMNAAVAAAAASRHPVSTSYNVATFSTLIG